MATKTLRSCGQDSQGVETRSIVWFLLNTRNASSPHRLTSLAGKQLFDEGRVQVTLTLRRRRGGDKRHVLSREVLCKDILCDHLLLHATCPRRVSIWVPGVVLHDEGQEGPLQAWSRSGGGSALLHRALES